MKSTISVAQAKRRINDKLSHFFGVTPAMNNIIRLWP